MTLHITYNFETSSKHRNIVVFMHAKYHPLQIMLLPKQRGINSLVSCMNYYYFRFSANVCRAVTMKRQKNHHYFKWIQSKFKEKEKLVVACLGSQEKLPTPKFYVLVVMMHVQSNVLLVKTHCLDVLTLLELPIMKPIGRI